MWEGRRAGTYPQTSSAPAQELRHMPQEGQCWMRINESKHAGRKVEEGRCRLEGFLEEVGGIFFFACLLIFFFSRSWVFSVACRLSLVLVSKGYSLVVVHRLLISVASLVAGHGL